MLSDISTVLCDLDGVVWLAHQPIPGSVEAIRALRASGRRVIFVTNNSAALIAEHEAALAAIGVSATGDVVSSAMAAAWLARPGERCLVTGGPGISEALAERGIEFIQNDGSVPDDVVFDAVVVGMDRNFDYARLRTAGRAVLAGARLIGTNGDSTYPTPQGLEPGGGSLVAAVATVGGVEPAIAGKPEQPMVDVVVETLRGRRASQRRHERGDRRGAERPFDPSRVLVVGDRPETDGVFAQRLGSPFALVESGVTQGDDVAPRDLPLAVRASDLAAIATQIV